MASRFLVVFEDGRQKRIESGQEDVSFDVVSIGPSQLAISENAGHFDFELKKLTNISDGTAATDASTVGQMQDYVDDAVASLGISEWLNSAFDITGTPPGSPSIGDRYLVSGTLTGAFVGHQDDIAEWSTGSAWVFTTPVIGNFISIDDETDGVYLYSGSSWSKKFFEGTTASTGLQKIGLDVRVKFEASNPTLEVDGNDALKVKFTDGLETGASGLGVKLDGSTLSKSGAGVKVADGGITGTQLAASVAGDGLTGGAGSALAVGAGTGISVTANAVAADWTLTKTNDNAGSLAIREFVYVKANGNVDKVSASTADLDKKTVGVVASTSIASAASGLITLLDGAIIGGFTGLDADKPLYVSNTAGGYIQSVSGLTAGQFVYRVGHAISSTEMIYSPEFIIEL